MAQKGPYDDRIQLADALAASFRGDESLKILMRTAGFAVAGGFSGSAIATWRHAPAIPAAFQSAVSTGATAFAFFSLREYLILPTSSYLYATRNIGISSPHFTDVPESALAGFGTGAFFGAYHFGASHRIATGGLTFSVLAALGQLTFNELNLQRLRFIKRRQDESSDLESRPIQPAKPPILQRVTESILSVSPIRKLSDDEYTDTLRAKIEHAQRELSIVGAQIEEAEAALEKSKV